MKRKNSFLFFAAALLLAACHTDADDAFQFNLQKGREYEFSRKYSLSQGGVLQSDIRSRFHATVVSTTADVVTLAVTYDSFLVNTRPQPVPGSDSSLMPVASPFSGESLAQAVYNGIRGKSFELLISRSGSVLGTNGLRELVGPVVNTLSLPPEQKKAGKEMMNAFGASVISQNLAQGFDIFPGRPVKVGDSWQKEMQQGGGLLPVAINTTYTVRDIRDGKIYLRVKALKSDNNQRGELLGDYTVDHRSGLVLAASITTKFGNPVIVSTSEELSGKERRQ